MGVWHLRIFFSIVKIQNNEARKYFSSKQIDDFFYLKRKIWNFILLQDVVELVEIEIERLNMKQKEYPFTFDPSKKGLLCELG